jgi:EpsI family protein
MNSNYFNGRNLLVGVAMAAAAGLTVAITPTRHVADQGPRVNLESMIPKGFGDWVIDEKVVYQQVSPQVKVALDKIYAVVLTRTYVNRQGYRIMLSIPYGVDQSDGLAAHDPEGCYPAQGFQIMSTSRDILKTSIGDIPVKRMEALSGERHEPVTYWVTVGNHAVNSDWARKKAQLGYALKGEIPDGMLVRVSSIDPDTQGANRIQAGFIEDLLKALPPKSRARVGGLAL